MEKPSAAKLIELYVECRNRVAKITDRYEKEISEYTNRMNLCENLLADEINRLEGQAIKTEHGTAYRSTLTSFKVADEDLWFNWVFDNGRSDMLTRAVAKEAVKEYLDTNGGAPPPGLNMSTIYKINVRSADK